MNAMARKYLAERFGLRGVLLILDARREDMSADDAEMARWVLEHNRPLLLAVTKCDLIPKNRRFGQLRKIERAIGVSEGTAVMCSSKTREGQDELRKRIQEAIA
jgi:GTP-binding protein EngB required for normal cell division